ncbi:hypothetical protein CVT24_005785 [Panaeolus cyanescens]|uniref:Uncharacterized protein n=1 Tax=Panaeolus cyanescens TaxID=181874 RepID=A0A409V927_9AGAR|nr:hypothetical protein CVT24_005785 [Panaeolus cyanescens]
MSSYSKPFRKSHRKRVSALRLSSDTTSSLPEYIPSQSWHPSTSILVDDEDKPPDYPDSAEEADEDTDQESHSSFTPHLPPSPSLPPRPLTASPRRNKRFLPTHKRRKSSQANLQSDLEQTDPYLDALLARSVHALEMSNTLLQSSISTQTSLSAILASDYPADSTLEVRARNLSSRINSDWEARAAWADDLEEITRDVEGLFWTDDQPSTSSSSPAKPYSRRIPSVDDAHGRDGSGVSCSLPSRSSPPVPIRKSRRRPSLDLRQASNSTATGQSPGLSYSQQDRSNLISPPPRALTQYVSSANDSGSLLLPSTLGLQTASSTHPVSDWKPLTELATSSNTSLLSSTSTLPPKLTDKLFEPTTPAYNMLSSFVYRSPSSGSNTPTASLTASFISRRRDSSSTISTVTSNSGIERNKQRKASKSPESRRRTPNNDSPNKFYDRVSSSAVSSVPTQSTSTAPTTPSSSRASTTSKGAPSPMAIRPMTPPTEESSSSSDSCVAKRTVQSLRKILDDQALQQNEADSPSKPTSITDIRHLRPPAFMPRSPPPVAEAGTSTATASISRLFTKGRHSSSTRAPSPPRQSAMKRSHPPSLDGSLDGSPLHSPLSPTGTGISDVVSKVLGTPSSSGRSTPIRRNISFAELPESYGSTKPGGAEGSSFRQRRDGSRKRRRKGLTEDQARGSGKGKGREMDKEEPSGWWGGFLAGSNVLGLGMGLSRHEERMEDRMTRNWGSRLGSSYGPGGLDEWAV